MKPSSSAGPSTISASSPLERLHLVVVAAARDGEARAGGRDDLELGHALFLSAVGADARAPPLSLTSMPQPGPRRQARTRRSRSPARRSKNSSRQGALSMSISMMRKFGTTRRKMRADHAAQMAVEIVRRDVDLVHVGHRRDLQRLRQTVPDHVDDRDVHRVVLEERLEVAPPAQRLARGDRAGRDVADRRERRRRRACRSPARSAPNGATASAMRLNPSVLKWKLMSSISPISGPDAVADRRQRRRAARSVAVVPVQFRPSRRAAEARRERGQLAVHDRQHVGLQRAEAARSRTSAACRARSS